MKSTTMPIFYEVDHIERLSKSLHQILAVELKCPLDFKTCVRVVCAGISIFRKSEYVPGRFVGHAWSTTAALNYLAGKGYLFDPRTAMVAIRLLETRHIIDRRRIDNRERPRTAGTEFAIGGRIPTRRAHRPSAVRLGA